MENNKSKKDGKNIVNPIVPEFRLKDIVQLIVGASILAVPIGFTEETWKLGESLPMLNIFLLFILSAGFISLFIYHHYHRHFPYNSWRVFSKRVFSTYLLSLIVVAIILGIIQRTPWLTEPLLAIKRIIIVAFPSSMSAVIADKLD